MMQRTEDSRALPAGTRASDHKRQTGLDFSDLLWCIAISNDAKHTTMRSSPS